MDGLTLCRELRQHEGTAEIPVIMLSAKTAQAAVKEGLDAGATKYLTKPIARAELIANLKSVLDIQ
jgi:DNA-binding response OmpR family regulator